MGGTGVVRLLLPVVVACTAKADAFRIASTLRQFKTVNDGVAGVSRVMLFHHDPERTDAEVAAIERAMRVGEDITVEAAREGVTVLLGASRTDQST